MNVGYNHTLKSNISLRRKRAKMNKVQELVKKGLIKPPSWLPDNVIYLTVTGSTAYGISTDESDYDVVGFCFPRRDMTFPHLAGEIFGFGKQKKRFEQYQQHHIWKQDELGGKGRNYDLAVYSIVRYFDLTMAGNPNLIDTLFTSRRCVLFSTRIAEMVREQRKLFLSKICYHKFRGYAFSQLHKAKPRYEKNAAGNIVRIMPKGKRRESVEKYDIDVKYLYHVVRLALECEQILEEHTLDLERNREMLKSIRRGEWTLERVEDWFTQKEKHLEDLYHTSTLPYSPNEQAIKQLLLDCLEMHYGSLENCVVMPDQYRDTILQIQELCDKAMKG